MGLLGSPRIKHPIAPLISYMTTSSFLTSLSENTPLESLIHSLANDLFDNYNV